MHKARYWESGPQALSCTLCPRFCILKDGEWGACGARRCLDGELFALSYGRVAALHVDPIEKKPLKRFMPGTLTLSLGAFGCNLFCDFCQNHSLSRSRPSDDVPFIPPEEIVERALAQGLPSVSYTYNEPLTNAEYVVDTATVARGRGLRNILVSNGYANEQVFEDVLALMDAMNIDVKSNRADAFRSRTGGALEIVMRNVERAAKRTHVEVTSLMVPGLCGPGDVEAIAQWLGTLGDIPLHITRYHPVKDGQAPATGVESMYDAKRRAENYLQTVYLGNV